MAIYIGYLLLAGLQIPLFYKKDVEGNRRFCTSAYLLVCCVELILLAGFRGYTVGADTAIYLNAVDYYTALPKSELWQAKLVFPFDFEWGYFLLTKIGAFLNLGKTGFLFIVALITYIPIFISIKNHSSIPYLSILTYFAFGIFSYSLGIFRQMIALSILLCGWKFVRERKLFKYLILVAVAMLFHTTAFLGIVLYILYGIKWKRIIWFVVPTEIVLLILGRPLALLMTQIFPQYAGYVNGQYDIQGGSYVMLILMNVILFVCVYLEKKGKYCDDMTICALILAIFLQAIGYSMAILGRVVPYFSIYLIFAVPDIAYGISFKWRKFVVVGVVCILLLLVFREFNGNYYVTPYYMFFEEVPKAVIPAVTK